VDDDVGAAFGQSQGSGAADAGGGPGDQGCLVGEVLVHDVLLSRWEGVHWLRGGDSCASTERL
jgi:hypothetical protein